MAKHRDAARPALSIDGSEPGATRGGLAERWADKPVARIDGHDIHAVIDEAYRTAVPGVTPHNPALSEARARGLHAGLSSLFGWLLRHRLVDHNPCTNVWRPPPSKPRDRVLSSDEIRALWHACDAIPAPYGAATKLLLLLGARLNEVSAMERRELNADGSTWTIPGARAKNHRSCIVSLPPLAREIIAAVPRVHERFVFSFNGTGPITGWSGAKHKLDDAMGSGMPAWHLHDLRRSAVTGMAELGVRADVIELCVNHVSGLRGGIAGPITEVSSCPSGARRWSAGRDTSTALSLGSRERRDHAHEAEAVMRAPIEKFAYGDQWPRSEICSRRLISTLARSTSVKMNTETIS